MSWSLDPIHPDDDGAESEPLAIVVACAAILAGVMAWLGYLG